MPTPTAPPQRRYASINETAEVFGISDRTVRRLIADGQMRAVRIGGQVRIPLSELDRIGTAAPIGNAS